MTMILFDGRIENEVAVRGFALFTFGSNNSSKLLIYCCPTTLPRSTYRLLHYRTTFSVSC